MALEEILKGDEPEDINDLSFEIDDTEEVDSDTTDDSEDIEIGSDIDDLIGDDDEIESDEEPVKPKAKDDGKVPRTVLIAERKKRQALEAQIEGLKKATGGSVSVPVVPSADSADPAVSDLRNEMKVLKFDLFAKDVPEALSHKEAVIKFAKDKGLDFESAYYALVGKSQSKKTKDDIEREVNARLEQRIKDASSSGKVTFTAGGAPKLPRGKGVVLTAAQNQICRLAGIEPKDYAKNMRPISWDEARKPKK